VERICGVLAVSPWWRCDGIYHPDQRVQAERGATLMTTASLTGSTCMILRDPRTRGKRRRGLALSA
jgi:hypothetical protein